MAPQLLADRVEFTSNSLLKITYVYKSDTFIDLAFFFIEADDKELFTESQKKHAISSRIITKSLSKTALIELIDVTTVYRDVRRKAINEILDIYKKKEFSAWAKRFPDEFYNRLCELKGWTTDFNKIKKPSIVGKYTNDIVYKWLAPGLLEKLQSKNPKNEKGVRKTWHHQWLTEDIGHPKLQEHIASIIALMKVTTNWNQFMRMVNKAFPIKSENLLFDIYKYNEKGEEDI